MNTLNFNLCLIKQMLYYHFSQGGKLTPIIKQKTNPDIKTTQIRVLRKRLFGVTTNPLEILHSQ